jgi:transposase-like protein
MGPKIMNCPHCGRILPKEFWHEKTPVEKVAVKCPDCGSIKTWKAGKYQKPPEIIQRYSCKDCGLRFSQR